MKNYVILIILALMAISCEQTPRPEPLISAAHAGRVPSELTRAVRIYHAEWNLPEPSNIKVFPSDTREDAFLVTVTAGSEIEYIGIIETEKKWIVFPSTPERKIRYGLP